MILKSGKCAHKMGGWLSISMLLHRGWNDTTATAFSRVPPEGLLKTAKSGLQLWIRGVKIFSCASTCNSKIMRKRSLISNLLILWQLIAIKY